MTGSAPSGSVCACCTNPSDEQGFGAGMCGGYSGDGCGHPFADHQYSGSDRGEHPGIPARTPQQIQERLDRLPGKHIRIDVSEPDYMQDYREFWADLVETGGQLDRDKVARELSDYHRLLSEVPLVYDELTGGRISKPHTRSAAVIREARAAAARGFGDSLRDMLTTPADDLVADLTQWADELEAE